MIRSIIFVFAENIRALSSSLILSSANNASNSERADSSSDRTDFFIASFKPFLLLSSSEKSQTYEKIKLLILYFKLKVDASNEMSAWQSGTEFG